jgi:hypothetical protein
MLSRALSLATVTLLIGLSAGSVRAQNLEAGKSPSQIFANTCTACHKSPRGLMKSVAASSLPGFLRQHYTTSSDMAGVLSSYLISNGANDPRYQGKDQPKGAKGAKGGRDARQEANQPPEQPSERATRRQHQGAAPQEAAKPDADGLAPQGEGRHGRRAARPSETPDGAKPADGQTPQAIGEGRPSRQKLGRRGRPAEEPKPDEATKSEAEKPSASKPASDNSAKVDAPKQSEPAAARPDPVPAVTPAPSAAPEPAAAAPAPPPVTATAPPPPPPPASTGPAGPPELPSSK